jgi:hypothetical protein
MLAYIPVIVVRHCRSQSDSSSLEYRSNGSPNLTTVIVSQRVLPPYANDWLTDPLIAARTNVRAIQFLCSCG